MKKRILFPVILLIVLLTVPFMARAGLPEDIPAGKNEIWTELYAFDAAKLPVMTWEDGEYNGQTARFITVSNMSALGITAATEHAWLWNGDYYECNPEPAADSLKQEDSILLIVPRSEPGVEYMFFTAKDPGPGIDKVYIYFEQNDSGPVGLSSVDITYPGSRSLKIYNNQYTIVYPVFSQDGISGEKQVVADYTFDGKLISAAYLVTVYGDDGAVEAGDCQYSFSWEQNGYTQKELKLTGYTDYARNLSMYSGVWYNTETYEEIAAPDGFDANSLPCVFVGPTTMTIGTAAESGDHSWMKPAPQERAVYASVPELKEAPFAPFVSTEKTDSGTRCTIDGLAAWGVTADTLNGTYYDAYGEEKESGLVSVGDGKWAVELPEEAYAMYQSAAADGKEISISFGTTDPTVYIEINTDSVGYTMSDNEQIYMIWNPSETEQATAVYSRSTGELIKYHVTVIRDTDSLYYIYEDDGAGGMKLTSVQYAFADSSAQYGQRTYEYQNMSTGWERTDYETWETLENVEVPEEILSRCVELPLI